MSQVRPPTKRLSAWVLAVQVAGFFALQTFWVFAPYWSSTEPDPGGERFVRTCWLALLICIGDVLAFLLAVGVVFLVLRWKRIRRAHSDGGVTSEPPPLPPA